MGINYILLETMWNPWYRDYALHPIKPQLSEISKGDFGAEVNLNVSRIPLSIIWDSAWCCNCFNPKRSWSVSQVQNDHRAHDSVGIWKPSFHHRLIFQFNPTPGLIIARCEGGAAQLGLSEETQEWFLAPTVLDLWQDWLQTSTW